MPLTPADGLTFLIILILPSVSLQILVFFLFFFTTVGHRFFLRLPLVALHYAEDEMREEQIALMERIRTPSSPSTRMARKSLVAKTKDRS